MATKRCCGICVFGKKYGCSRHCSSWNSPHSGQTVDFDDPACDSYMSYRREVEPCDEAIKKALGGNQ